MPKLVTIETEKLVLPSSTPEDEAFVVVKKKFTAGDWAKMVSGSDNLERTMFGLASYITEWNFTEDGTPEGEKVPITTEAIGRLELKDFNFLAEKLTAANADVAKDSLNDEQKKTSSDTLMPSIPTPQGSQTQA